jgi:KDO2-lipid IV(A) lauroyltransferase
VERLSAWLLARLIRALSLLSLTSQRRLGRFIGTMAWYARSDGRRITEVNLQTCFPELDVAQRRRLARRSLQNTAMLFTELGAVYHWPQQRWQGLTVETHGGSSVDRAVSDGIGVLVLVPHFGNWEYMALVLGRYGLTALYDPPRLAALEPMMRDARNRAGARLLRIDAGGLRSIYQTLKGGRMAALLPDQVPARDAGVYAEFFGHPALTMTFAHRLTRRTGARVFIGAAMRCSGGFRVTFEDPGAEFSDPDPLVSARAMNRAIEALVRRDPAQYQWEYKRFKRQPPASPDPYARQNVSAPPEGRREQHQ